MKAFRKILILLILFMLVFLSYTGLCRHPLSVFMLKNDDVVEAFEVKVFLGRYESTIAPLKLSSEQRYQALDILKTKNEDSLRSLSHELGKFDIVAGETGDKVGDPWPWYLGGGWNVLFIPAPQGYFDDSGWYDRVYLAMTCKAPPPLPFNPTEIPLNEILSTPSNEGSLPVESKSTPVAPAATVSAVRVEILNGCGITNAADWVARKLKGRGIVVVSTGNADSFDYPKTVVKSSIGRPILLEDALNRLGLSKDSLEDGSSVSATVDVTVIIGKDFNMLKERARDRRHH